MEETKKIIEEVQIKRRENTKNQELLSSRIKNNLLNKKRIKKEKESYYTAQKLLKNNRENQKSFNYFKKQTSINRIQRIQSLSNNSAKNETPKEKSNTLKLNEEKITISKINAEKGLEFNSKKENLPIIILRIVGMNERISKKITNVLKEFKLLKLFSASIVDYTSEIFEKIQLINSYVTWGFVNKKTVNSLVIKKGSVLENKVLKELNNQDIESNLGKHDILCIEDIVYELSAALSKNRKIVMNYLGFFLLSPCEELKDNALKPYYIGGNTGYRGDKINDLVNKMI